MFTNRGISNYDRQLKNPIHIRPYELIYICRLLDENNNVYLSPKADGIYSQQVINKINVEAEHILGKYLIFDTPSYPIKHNNTYENRINWLSLTLGYKNKIKEIYSTDQLIENLLIDDINNNNNNNNDYYVKSVYKIKASGKEFLKMLEVDLISILNYPTDGFIITIDEFDHAFKYKPLDKLTIDVYCNQGNFISSENVVIFNEQHFKNGIWRCYWSTDLGSNLRSNDIGSNLRSNDIGSNLRSNDLGSNLRSTDLGSNLRSTDLGSNLRSNDNGSTNNENKWIPIEHRIDKSVPNKTSTIRELENFHYYPWNSMELEKMLDQSYYYSHKATNMSKQIILMIDFFKTISNNHINLIIEQQLKNMNCANVLDIGCGNSKIITNRMTKYVGIDIDPICITKNVNLKKHKKSEWFWADFNSEKWQIMDCLPINVLQNENSFNIFIIKNCINYVNNLDDFIKTLNYLAMLQSMLYIVTLDNDVIENYDNANISIEKIENNKFKFKYPWIDKECIETIISSTILINVLKQNNWLLTQQLNPIYNECPQLNTFVSYHKILIFKYVKHC
jgi:2-polyprenyl-3-methyl-5-hydroxy-6-metoxy-1,4-benzoquinol methylase